ncbi:MAG TPA: single-stranded DNA-binding protein [Bryobacteraceae bacterium]
MDYNKVQLAGHVAADPETRTTKSSKVTTGSLGVNYTVGQGDTRERGVNFIDFEAWGKTSDIFEKYVKKGKGVFIEGHLVKKVWDGQDQVRHSRLAVVVDRVILLDGPKDQQQTKGGK